MAYPELTDLNTSEGLHTIYIHANSIIPILTPLILFSIFVVAMLGSYFTSIRLRGDAKLSSSFAMAGFFVSVIALFMSFIPGFINLSTLIICFGIGIVGFLWIIFDTD